MAVIRTIFIILLVIYGVRFIARLLFPLMMKGLAKRMDRKMKEQMGVDPNHDPQKFSQDIPGPDEVEDVDYQEVKD